MRVLVVGAGVVGLTSAYALAADGAQVVVVDRADRAAADTSAVNAGLMSPGHTLSWNAPSVFRELPRLLTGRHPHLEVPRLLDRELVPWGLAFLRRSMPGEYRRTSLVRWHLARWSLELLLDLVDREGIDSALTREGVLFLHRDEEPLNAQFDALAMLRRRGEDVRFLDARAIARMEPAIAQRGDVAGAVHDVDGCSGDCAAFTRGLEQRCLDKGVDVEYGVEVASVLVDDRRARGVRTANGGVLEADAVVLAAGAHTPRLLGPAGRRLRIYPVKGYGLTWDGVGDFAPRRPGVDEHAHVAWAPYGDRLRVTGGAAFTGFDQRVDHRRVAAIVSAAHRLFPELRGREQPTPRPGLRALTPDGLPHVGPFAADNLFVNAGHGNLGWTLSAASARLLAAHVAGDPIDPTYRALLPPDRAARWAPPRNRAARWAPPRNRAARWAPPRNRTARWAPSRTGRHALDRPTQPR